MEITKQSVERSGNLNPMWGKKQSMATRQKISDREKSLYINCWTKITYPSTTFNKPLTSLLFYLKKRELKLL